MISHLRSKSHRLPTSSTSSCSPSHLTCTSSSLPVRAQGEAIQLGFNQQYGRKRVASSFIAVPNHSVATLAVYVVSYHPWRATYTKSRLMRITSCVGPFPSGGRLADSWVSKIAEGCTHRYAVHLMTCPSRCAISACAGGPPWTSTDVQPVVNHLLTRDLCLMDSLALERRSK